MKPVNVKSKTYIDSSKEINDKYSKFKVGDIAIISKYKNVFANGYTPNWSEEVFVIEKVKNTVLWTYLRIPLMRRGRIYGQRANLMSQYSGA